MLKCLNSEKSVSKQRITSTTKTEKYVNSDVILNNIHSE